MTTDNMRVGDRFGDRIVVSFRKHTKRGHQAFVRCDCGQLKWIDTAALRAGRADRCRPCRDKRNATVLRERMKATATIQTVRCPQCSAVFNTTNKGDS